MNEAILDKKIKLWEDQLLDLGKRNKMISFRETKRSTLKILKPGFDDLYQQLVEDEKELTFQKAIDRDSDVRVYAILSLLDKLSSPIEVNIGDIRAEGSLAEIKKTLKHLRSKAKLALDEQGTNILYLVFGFIEWREKGSRNDNWIKSPLILVPVSLLLPSLDAQYSLKRHEDEIVVNPTLAYLFERDYGITLPDFDSDKDSLESFMRKMERLVDDRGWRIVRECSMGLVSFLKISMYNDLIRNEEQLKANPIVRAFAGEQNSVNSMGQYDTEFDHDSCRAVDSYQVLDADSSQQDAIMLSQKGVSFVMQGPPGTGKSQTITNIIAQALADGKKVLFVSEKMAALDVVYRRLTDVHLSDFCLSLHSHKANKKEILNQLGNNLTMQRIKVKDEEIAKLTRLDMIKEKLKAYVNDIHTTVMPLEMSLYEVYGAILELGSLPDIDLHLANVDQLAKDDVNRLALLVMNLDKAQGVLGTQWYKNPWQGITCSYLEVSQKRELQNKLQDTILVISSLEECKLIEKNLAEIITLGTLDTFWLLCEHAHHCSVIPETWFARTTEQEEKLVQLLREKKQNIDVLKNHLGEHYDHDFLALDGEQLLSRLTNYLSICRSKLRHISSDKEAFERLAEDYKLLAELRELCEVLLDAFNVITSEYQLEFPCEYRSIETLLTVCTMLHEKRNVTDRYWGTDNIQQLKQNSTAIHAAFELLESKERQLCKHYNEAILDTEEAEKCLRCLNQASSILQGEYNYSMLQKVAAFDTGKLHTIEAAYSSQIISDVSAEYGFEQPHTPDAVERQIAGMSVLPELQVLPYWKHVSQRNHTKQILRQGQKYSTELRNLKGLVHTFFDHSGIVLDVEKITADELAKLREANKPVLKSSVLLDSCNLGDSYTYLDEISRRQAEYSDLNKSIAHIRSQYRIGNHWDHASVLTVLRKVRPTLECCTISDCWIYADKEGPGFLAHIIPLANELRIQHAKLTAVYEDSVFEFDYLAMLNRFKTEYTGAFKVFKRRYKEDINQIRLVCKDVRRKISDDEIIALLQELRQYNSNLQVYRNWSARALRVLGIKDYDIWYDWESVRKGLDAFSYLCDCFANREDAYRFVSTISWEEVIATFEQHAELDCWFENNQRAKEFYGDLYKGHDTDTENIRKALEHANSVSSIFVSASHFLSFNASDDEIQQAARIVELREWFASNAEEIHMCAGPYHSESSDLWDEVARNLERYESMVDVFGEKAAYSLVMAYDNDRQRIKQYVDTLHAVAEIRDCIKTVYHTDANSKEMLSADIHVMIKDMTSIVAQAEEVLEVYAFLERFRKNPGSELTADVMKTDLEAILSYQDSLARLPELEDKARSVLGAEYCGMATDWDAIDSNIQFCEKVTTLLSGKITTKLVEAFVNATSMYSESQVRELLHFFAKAKELEHPFRGISGIKQLDVKIRQISEAMELLQKVIDIKDTVEQNAFSACTYDAITEDLQKLTSLQNAQRVYDEELLRAKRLMPALNLSGDTDWDYVSEVFDHMKQIKRIVRSESLDGEVVQWVTNKILGIRVDTYYEQLKKLIQYKNNIEGIIDLFANKAALESFNLARLAKRFKSCLDQFATMDAWIDLRDCRKACQDNGLEDFVTRAEDAYYPAGSLMNVFLKSFYYEWFEKICAGTESVANFRVRTQETRISDFRDLNAHHLPVSQMRIRERLIRDMPSRHNFGRATDEMSVLLHELNKKRNIMPLRKLFRTIPNLLLRLKPCLMMSPLSVSYFLEAETYKFDMVIFDEASQIFPQDAIGAIFRGKQVIVTGDSKQLPPTNFFAASTNNDTDFDIDDEDQDDVVYDSILEEATNSLPNRSLLWHYRSRYEDLISFSNQEIYQNNLITFPSSTTHVSDTGVEYVYVKNGVYENRCNRIEAQHIVQMVVSHIKNHPERSLGIIAFSESQQSVIEDEINKFRLKHPQYERFFDEDIDEPFFVKNLENVQGDERDTIFFSICYAKNAQGRMYMRFGPLGNQGGERRLNVAITRAKHNIKLVGSILPEDIDLSKTHSEGVRMLRSYIGFAMHGNVVLTKPEKKNILYDVDTFSEQVGKFLTSRGCKVQMNVGNSEYTIDIAVEHPKRPGYYIAGIECDGNSYYMARTVQDREHLRTAVLERMGWKMYRVWSTEWIRNPAAEQERLMSFIREALLHYGEVDEFKPISSNTSDLVGTEVVKTTEPLSSASANNPYGFPDYREGKWWEVGKYRASDNLSMLADRILAVVKVEQPIHIELLYRRMADAFGMTKATQGVRDTVDEAIRKRMHNEIYISDQFVYMERNGKINARRSEVGSPDRVIEHISIPEIAAAMERILVGAIGMERTVLCSEAARVFGFERNGPKIKQRTNEAVDHLVRMNKATVCDGKVQLLEE